MNTTIFALFHAQENAEDAINELKENGFQAKDLSIIMRDQDIAKEVAHTTNTKANAGITTGAATGGIVGGIAGLLVGTGAIIVPSLGAVLIAGPIAAGLGLIGTAASTVSGAIGGAVAGGLLGGLIGLGLPQEEAHIYEISIKSGSILVAVSSPSFKESTAKHILERNNADQIRSVQMETVNV